jgi:hypothetical protein
MTKLIEVLKTEFTNKGLNSENFEFIDEYPRYIVKHIASGRGYKIDYEVCAFLTVVHGVDGEKEAAYIVCQDFKEIFEAWTTDYMIFYRERLEIDDPDAEAIIRDEMDEIWNKLDEDLRFYLKSQCEKITTDYTV